MRGLSLKGIRSLAKVIVKMNRTEKDAHPSMGDDGAMMYRHEPDLRNTKIRFPLQSSSTAREARCRSEKRRGRDPVFLRS